MPRMPAGQEEERLRLLVECRYANELPKPPPLKLLTALPSVERMCRYRPHSLEGDHEQLLLSERGLLSRVEMVDPTAYGVEPVTGAMAPPAPPQDAQLLRDDDLPEAVREMMAKRRRMAERTEASHRQAFGLQLPQLITNDVFTERQIYTVGLDAAEKKLTREPPGFDSVEDLARRIEGTFAAAREPPVHPSKPSMRPKRILEVVPDATLWVNKYKQVVFDELPKTPAPNDLLLKSTPQPRITCFAFFNRPDGEEDYRLAENYVWDNRGAYTRAEERGEGEAMLLSIPAGETPTGEARFVTVPTYMKMKKQQAFNRSLRVDFKTVTVTAVEPTAAEAEAEQQRAAMVLEGEAVTDKSEASLDFVDGRWTIRHAGSHQNSQQAPGDVTPQPRGAALAASASLAQVPGLRSASPSPTGR